jgi:hypothetical protein
MGEIIFNFIKDQLEGRTPGEIRRKLKTLGFKNKEITSAFLLSEKEFTYGREFEFRRRSLDE